MILEGIAAVWLLGNATYCSHALAVAMLPRGRIAERWSLASVISISAAIAAFQILALFGAFRLEAAATLGPILSALTLGATRQGPIRVFVAVGRDLIAAVLVVIGSGGPVPRLLRVLLATGMLSVLWRALVLPPLGWDSITYHAPKAALWLQSGGSLPFDLPGGWAFYRYYPPGGEILAAWAMLPFHDDTFYLLVDVVFWLLWAPVLICLQRELEIRKEWHLGVCVYLMCVPAVYYFIPSGYVDPPPSTCSSMPAYG